MGGRRAKRKMKTTLTEEIKASLFRSMNVEAEKINEIIRGELRSQPSELYDAAYYLPSIGGKRMRPYLTVATSRLFGEADLPVYQAGVSVELLHNFTLVHDDIMDRDNVRRGRPTAHRKFGIATAILASDLLFSKSMQLASDVEIRVHIRGISKLIADTSIRVDEGQFLDMSFEKRVDVSTSDYLGMIGLKTAAMYECSAELGGMVGGAKGRERIFANREELLALKSFGHNLGLAFQIRDDYLGCFGDPRLTGKTVGNDIRRGKKTYVVLSAFEHATERERDQIRKVLGSHRAKDEEIRNVISILRGLGVDKACSSLVKQFEQGAISNLRVFAGGERKILGQLATFAANREN
jgi:geranylgeranyl diphosphate synthase, type I